MTMKVQLGAIHTVVRGCRDYSMTDSLYDLHRPVVGNVATTTMTR